MTNFPDIESVRRDLESGGPVTRTLPGDGRLYIERPQPFLCLYRRPAKQADTGTDQLLTTQTSYLITSEDEPAQARLAELLETILGQLSTSFGAVLLFEIWAGAPLAPDPETGKPVVRFKVFAPTKGVPIRTLEELEV